MLRSSVARDPPVHHACEPCRRKKIKCTAERPACSCCQRLGQACAYGTRFTRSMKSLRSTKKPPSLRDKVKDLESQVHVMHELLQSTSNNSPFQPIMDHARIPNQNNPIESTIPTYNPDLSMEALEHAIGVYRTTMHLQPLPLFRIPDLLDYLVSSPEFLRHSFLSLTLGVNTAPIYQERQNEIAERYESSARDVVLKRASEGSAGLELIQSLCLLTMRDILGCKPNQAQVTIGLASRLEASRISTSASVSSPLGDHDLSLRCRWSVFILEKIFTPHLCAYNEDIQDLAFPTSAPVPPILAPPQHEDYPPDLYNAYNSKEDCGITAYYIKMVSLSGQLSSWLRLIRLGKHEIPWSPESRYARLVAKAYECDAQLPACHLLRNVAFSRRTPDDISQHKEYWIPWILMQVECHASLSLLNHPFIHLVAVRNGSKGSQSGLFLQNTIDSAIFNSRWVFRFLRLCDNLQLQLYDPLIAHLVAAVATVPWLLQFVEDEKVSQEATLDVSWCKGYLRRSSTVWPHISQKLDSLQRLDLIADHYRQTPSEKLGGVTFPPSLLWDLLSPEICLMRQPQNSEGGPQTDSPKGIPDTKIRITTHLTHPLTESKGTKPSLSSNSISDSWGFFDPYSIEEMNVDDVLASFAPDVSGLEF